MPTKPKVALEIPLGKAFEQKLVDRYEIVPGASAREGVRALVTIGAIETGGARMDALPDLGLICCFGSGYEGIDLAAAKARGIKVANSVGANASAVADLAVALLLAAMRKVVAGDRLVRSGEWRGSNASSLLFLPGLAGRRIGVLGLGAIGEKIAERLAAFETEIGYHSRKPKSGSPYRYFDSLKGMAEWTDVLMIAHRADETNRHMVNADVLAALGADGFVVNISRGSAIDEDALVAALKDRRIAGAGLDVFEGEPDVRADLRALDNVVMTPHLGGGTREALGAMSDAVVANIDAFFAGKPLPNPVI
jgi:lactate dehydrogenase-like 2-hydroxyacid dehydrogenase